MNVGQVGWPVENVCYVGQFVCVCVCDCLAHGGYGHTECMCLFTMV